jgi:circadian clock protein KaiC
MIAGGIPKHSSTLLCGDTGIGKTSFGLQFICSGATAGEKGIVVTFDENMKKLTDMATAIGLDLRQFLKSNSVVIVEENSHFLDMPKHVSKLEKMIGDTGATRVFVDDLERYLEILGKEEGIQYVRCLSATLKNRNATPMFSYTAGNTIGNSEKIFQMDNRISLKYVRSMLGFKRSILIRKLAYGIAENKIRELVITPEGMDIKGELSTYC